MIIESYITVYIYICLHISSNNYPDIMGSPCQSWIVWPVFLDSSVALVETNAARNCWEARNLVEGEIRRVQEQHDVVEQEAGTCWHPKHPKNIPKQ